MPEKGQKFQEDSWVRKDNDNAINMPKTVEILIGSLEEGIIMIIEANSYHLLPPRHVLGAKYLICIIPHNLKGTCNSEKLINSVTFTELASDKDNMKTQVQNLGSFFLNHMVAKEGKQLIWLVRTLVCLPVPQQHVSAGCWPQ